MPPEKLVHIGQVLQGDIPANLDHRSRRRYLESAGLEASQVTHEIVHSVAPDDPSNEFTNEVVQSVAHVPSTDIQRMEQIIFPLRDSHEGLVEAGNKTFSEGWLRRTGLDDPDVLSLVTSVFSYPSQKLLADELYSRVARSEGEGTADIVTKCGRLGNSEAAVTFLAQRMLPIRDREALHRMRETINDEMHRVHIAWEGGKGYPFPEDAARSMRRIDSVSRAEVQRLMPGLQRVDGPRAARSL
jgi:hypothetical protein